MILHCCQARWCLSSNENQHFPQYFPLWTIYWSSENCLFLYWLVLMMEWILWLHEKCSKALSPCTIASLEHFDNLRVSTEKNKKSLGQSTECIVKNFGCDYPVNSLRMDYLPLWLCDGSLETESWTSTLWGRGWWEGLYCN